jgi:hypothetical protein
MYLYKIFVLLNTILLYFSIQKNRAQQVALNPTPCALCLRSGGNKTKTSTFFQIRNWKFEFANRKAPSDPWPHACDPLFSKIWSNPSSCFPPISAWRLSVLENEGLMRLGPRPFHGGKILRVFRLIWASQNQSLNNSPKIIIGETCERDGR